jgi:hypothetical protein
MKYQIFSMDGRLIKEGILEINTGYEKHNIKFSEQGIFLFQLTDMTTNQVKTHKVIVWQ